MHPPPQRPTRNEALLIALLYDVNRARQAYRAGRGEPLTAANRLEQVHRTAHLVEAMEAYADATATVGIPLPYRYRNELRLYKATLYGPYRSLPAPRTPQS